MEPGDRVAIMATNRIEHVLADIGAMRAGATAMSIYNTLSPSQVSYVAGHSTPAVVVLENADHVARWQEAFAEVTPKRVVVIDRGRVAGEFRPSQMSVHELVEQMRHVAETGRLQETAA
mgnify:CR=1 FL=1